MGKGHLLSIQLNISRAFRLLKFLFIYNKIFRMLFNHYQTIQKGKQENKEH